MGLLDAVNYATGKVSQPVATPGASSGTPPKASLLDAVNLATGKTAFTAPTPTPTTTQTPNIFQKALPAIKSFFMGEQGQPAVKDVAVYNQVTTYRNELDKKLQQAKLELDTFYKTTPVTKRISRIIPGDKKQKEVDLQRTVTNYETAVSDLDDFVGKNRANKGLFAKMKENFADPGGKLVPFYAEVEKTYTTARSIQILKKYERGEQLDANEQSVLDRVRSQYYNTYVQQGLGDQVADVITGIPKFIGEMALTGSMSLFAKPALAKLGALATEKISSKLAGRVVNKVIQNSVQLAVQGSLAFPSITAASAEYMLPTVDYETKLGTQDILTMLKPGDSTTNAVLKGYTSNLLNYVSEGVGGYIDDAVPFLKKAFIGKWLKNNGMENAEAGVVKAFLKKYNFNSLIGEVIEEEVAQPIQNWIDKTKYKDPFFTPEGRERLLVEVLGIGAFSGMAKVTDKSYQALIDRKETTKDVVDIPVDRKKAEEVIQAPTPTSPGVSETVSQAKGAEMKSESQGSLVSTIREQLSAGNEEFVDKMRQKVKGNPTFMKAFEAAVVEAQKSTTAPVKKPQTIKGEVPEVNVSEKNLLKIPGTKLAWVNESELMPEPPGTKTGRVVIDDFKKKILAGESIEPVVLSTEKNAEGQFVVRDGNHVLQAMRELGITKIPTIATEAKEVYQYHFAKGHAATKKKEEKVKGKKSIAEIKKRTTRPRPVKPKEYAKDKTAIYDSVTIGEANKYLTNEEAFTVIKKYFSADELPVDFVENMKTPAGGDAWGKYATGMVTFINNPKAETPTHEAVHAFLDLFVRPAQKDLYIAKMQRQLLKDMGKEALNKAVRQTQVENSYPGKKPIPMFVASRIYAEDAIADDFVKYVKAEEKKSTLHWLYDRIIRFIRSVINQKNIQTLYQDIIARKREVTNPIMQSERDYFLKQQVLLDATTKTLNRMRGELVRDEVSRDTILSYLKREGVTKLDAELVAQSLNEMPGERVNVAQLIEKVQAQIMPIALIRSSTFHDTGTGHISYSIYPNMDEKDMYNFRNDTVQETHIWDTPYRHGVSAHFSEDYGNKKIGYRIEERTEPDTGNKIFFVVEKDIMLNQENVNEAVATTSETRKGAEDWIEEHKKDIEQKKSGLFGHSRVASTLTKKVIVKQHTERIRAQEARIEENEKDIKLRKQLYTVFNQNTKEIVKRINKKIDEMLMFIAKEKRSMGSYPDLDDIIDNYSEYQINIKGWGLGRGVYSRIVVYSDWMKDILKGYKLPAESKTDNTDYFGVLTDLVGDLESVDISKLTQKRLMEKVKYRLSIRDLFNTLTEAKASLKIMQDVYYKTINEYKPIEPMRYIMEVQADPFQSRYRVTTELEKVNKRLEELVWVENDSTPAEKITSEIEKEYARLKERKKELEGKPSQLETQFFALGNRFHEVAIKREVQLAAKDMVTEENPQVKLRVATPLTSAYIEGFVGRRDFNVINGSLVKPHTEISSIMDAQMNQEMPPKPIPPLGEGHEGQEVFLATPEMIEKGLGTGDFLEINGTLYEVVEMPDNPQGAALVFVENRDDSDYHLNSFDDMNEPEEKDVGDDVTYMGTDYTILSQDGSTWEVAKSDRVRDIDFDDAVEENVDNEISEVEYELKSMEKDWGKIDSAHKAQEILDAEDREPAKTLIPGLEKQKVSFDYYETKTVLESMASEDPLKTDLDYTDYEEKARESLYEDQSQMLSETSYWEEMSEKAYFFDDGRHILLVEEGGEIENIEAPDSDYNVFPRYELQQSEFDNLQKEALKASGKSTKQYEKELGEYDKQVLAVKEKYDKLKEQYKTSPPPPSLNKLGEYQFNTDFFGGKGQGEEMKTVYNYYERTVLPFFRKLRKDAHLVTDQNGFQWWETEVTGDDLTAPEIFQRKTTEETLLAMTNQIIAKQRALVAPTKRTATRPVKVRGKKLPSMAYSRIVDDIREEEKQNVYYNQMTIDEDVANAVMFESKHPELAIRIGKGLEYPPQGITETAIARVAAQRALERNDHALWSQLVASRSLRQTRRGQEIVSEKGQVTNDSPEYFIRQVLKEKQAVALEKKGWVYAFKKKKKMSFAMMIEDEVENAKTKVDKAISNNLKSAQSILDSITCK